MKTWVTDMLQENAFVIKERWWDIDGAGMRFIDLTETDIKLYIIN